MPKAAYERWQAAAKDRLYQGIVEGPPRHIETGMAVSLAIIMACGFIFGLVVGLVWG